MQFIQRSASPSVLLPPTGREGKRQDRRLVPELTKDRRRDAVPAFSFVPETPLVPTSGPEKLPPHISRCCQPSPEPFWCFNTPPKTRAGHVITGHDRLGILGSSGCLATADN